MSQVSFSTALERIRAGGRATRAGWNKPGQFVFYVPGSTIQVQAGRPLGEAAPELIGQTVTYRPHIDIYTAQGDIATWVPSISDVLADDWLIVTSGMAGDS